jgi:Domain of unknown function (DUF397)
VTTYSGRFLTAPELDGAAWKKSSHSGGSESQCVEVADVTTAYGGIAVRDSKDPNGAALMFAPASFASFIADVAAGRFDL